MQRTVVNTVADTEDETTDKGGVYLGAELNLRVQSFGHLVGYRVFERFISFKSGRKLNDGDVVVLVVKRDVFRGDVIQQICTVAFRKQSRELEESWTQLIRQNALEDRFLLLTYDNGTLEEGNELRTAAHEFVKLLAVLQ